jgi:hypothetical protein
MNTVDVIIIISVFTLVAYMINNIFNKNKNNKNNKNDKLKGIQYESNIDSYNNDNNSNSNKENKYNKYNKYDNSDKLYSFNNSKLHNDYKEVLATITTMTNGKNIFNISEKPVKITKPSKKKIFNLVNQFVNELSNKSMSISSVSNISDGWLTSLPLNKEVDGWEKQMKLLGLPTSIYNKSAKPSILKLIKIKKYISQETQDDARITCQIICQKVSSKDRIILDICFWIDKRDINDERKLFKDKDDSLESDSELPIVIEKIDILGFMIRDNSGINDDTARKTFYNFKGLKNKDGIMDQQKLMEQVLQKRIARAKDTNTKIDQAELQQIKLQNDILNRDVIVDNSELIFDE